MKTRRRMPLRRPRKLVLKKPLLPRLLTIRRKLPHQRRHSEV